MDLPADPSPGPGAGPGGVTPLAGADLPVSRLIAGDRLVGETPVVAVLHPTRHGEKSFAHQLRLQLHDLLSTAADVEGLLHRSAGDPTSAGTEEVGAPTLSDDLGREKHEGQGECQDDLSHRRVLYMG